MKIFCIHAVLLIIASTPGLLAVLYLGEVLFLI